MNLKSMGNGHLKQNLLSKAELSYESWSHACPKRKALFVLLEFYVDTFLWEIRLIITMSPGKRL